MGDVERETEFAACYQLKPKSKRGIMRLKNTPGDGRKLTESQVILKKPNYLLLAPWLVPSRLGPLADFRQRAAVFKKKVEIDIENTHLIPH